MVLDTDLNYRTYRMPRRKWPHLPTRAKLYEGINPPSSQKTLLTVRQINAFYDAGNTIGHTRKALAKADLTPLAFGPMLYKQGQPPMLFRAGDAKRVMQMANTAATLNPTPIATSAATTPLVTPTIEKVLAKEPGPEFGLITEEETRGYYSTRTYPPTQDVPYGFTARQWQDDAQAEAGVDGYTTAALPKEPEEEPEEEVQHATPSDEERLRDSVEITFNAVVDDESCDDLLQKMTEAIDGGAKDITLWISSEGGSLFSALGLYDRLRYLQRTHNINIFTVATGYVLSAGTILMAAGARRYSLPHTVFMLHEPYQMPWESGEDAKVLVTEIGERQELHELSLKKIAHIFYERDPRPEADEEAWLDIFRVPSKKYFGADEALQWGLVDALL